MTKTDNILRIIACPACRVKLNANDIEAPSVLSCPACGKVYETRDGVFFMLPSAIDHTLKDDISGLGMARNGKKSIVRSAVKKILSYSPSSGGYLSIKARNSAIERYKESGTVVNVGSGTTQYGGGVINLDMFPFDNVDIVGDACRLPFADDSVDVIFSFAVLEHVYDPKATIDEMKRVLRKGGTAIVGLPFIQGFHAHDNTEQDYHRFTVAGVRNLLKDFNIVSITSGDGPAVALGWISREFFSILFSFGNDRLYSILKAFFGVLLFPLKYADILFVNNKLSHKITSGFLAVAEKI